MNEELTREVLEAMVKCDTICSRCKAVELCSEGTFNTLRILATALIEGISVEEIEAVLNKYAEELEGKE